MTATTVDTNVLVRAIVEDDVAQARKAQKALRGAAPAVISNPVLCELFWVLKSGYGRTDADIATVIHRLVATSNVEMDRAAALFALGLLHLGGDFADGIIAYEGHAQGGEVFVSFDRAAVKRLRQAGRKARAPD